MRRHGSADELGDATAQGGEAGEQALRVVVVGATVQTGEHTVSLWGAGQQHTVTCLNQDLAVAEAETVAEGLDPQGGLLDLGAGDLRVEGAEQRATVREIDGVALLVGEDRSAQGRVARGELREDLAELAVDELVEMTGIDEERAKETILKARAHWFE